MNWIFGIMLLFALIVCPAAYMYLVFRMKKVGIKAPPIIGYFCLFGTTGGWFLAMSMGATPIAAACGFFLLTFAPLSLLAVSLFLFRQRRLSVYHRVVYWGSTVYVILWIFLILSIVIH
jgi:hypothetical protein